MWFPCWWCRNRSHTCIHCLEGSIPNPARLISIGLPSNDPTKHDFIGFSVSVAEINADDLKPNSQYDYGNFGYSAQSQQIIWFRFFHAVNCCVITWLSLILALNLIYYIRQVSRVVFYLYSRNTGILNYLRCTSIIYTVLHVNKNVI